MHIKHGKQKIETYILYKPFENRKGRLPWKEKYSRHGFHKVREDTRLLSAREIYTPARSRFQRSHFISRLISHLPSRAELRITSSCEISEAVRNVLSTSDTNKLIFILLFSNDTTRMTCFSRLIVHFTGVVCFGCACSARGRPARILGRGFPGGVSSVPVSLFCMK